MEKKTHTQVYIATVGSTLHQLQLKGQVISLVLEAVLILRAGVGVGVLAVQPYQPSTAAAAAAAVIIIIRLRRRLRACSLQPLSVHIIYVCNKTISDWVGVGGGNIVVNYCKSDGAERKPCTEVWRHRRPMARWTGFRGGG